MPLAENLRLRLSRLHCTLQLAVPFGPVFICGGECRSPRLQACQAMCAHSCSRKQGIASQCFRMDRSQYVSVGLNRVTLQIFVQHVGQYDCAKSALSKH